MCLKFLLRDDFESLICWLDHWLSCMLDCIHVCVFFFFTSRKNVFKSLLDTFSIPCCLSSFFSFFLSQSQQLLNTWWIDRECFCILDSISTPGGSIENASTSSIASWHLVDQSRFWSGIWWYVPRYLIDTFCCRRPFFFSTPFSTDVSTPLDTSSVEIYC